MKYYIVPTLELCKDDYYQSRHIDLLIKDGYTFLCYANTYVCDHSYLSHGMKFSDSNGFGTCGIFELCEDDLIILKLKYGLSKFFYLTDEEYSMLIMDKDKQLLFDEIRFKQLQSFYDD